MKTLFHPNMRDTSIQVEDKAVPAYVAQGWRKTDPSKKRPARTTTPTVETNDSFPIFPRNRVVTRF